MKRLHIREFAKIVDGQVEGSFDLCHISSISVQSGHITSETLFVALPGSLRDGHQFVGDAFDKGAVAALVSRHHPFEAPLDRPIIYVEDTLAALGRLAEWCREQLEGQVVAITGSNGKTMVKDALYQILSSVEECSASPGSFNNCLGVALSLIGANVRARFSLIEAGVSHPGDMEPLQQMIRPHFGILTNIGWAHYATFGSREKIAREKMQLFREIPEEGWVLIPAGEALVESEAKALKCRVFRYGEDSDGLPVVMNQTADEAGIRLELRFPSGASVKAALPTQSQEALTDVFIAVCTAHLLGVMPDRIEQSLLRYSPRSTRREVWKSPTGVTLISDTYSSEPLSVQSALRALSATGSGRRFFVFGGREALGREEAGEYEHVGRLAARYGVDDLIMVGPGAQSAMCAFQEEAPQRSTRYFEASDGAKEYLLAALKWGDTLLVKAAWNTRMDHLASAVLEAMAPNRLYVDLQAVRENVQRFRRLVGPGVRILAMIKALAYGIDSTRLALELQDIGVDFCGVSSADEGSALRAAGVHLPILVMACGNDEIEKLFRYELTPVIYSAAIAEKIIAFAGEYDREIGVHIEVDTGLGRMGIFPEELPHLIRRICECANLTIRGIMTHFASADTPSADDFTRKQMACFDRCRETVISMNLPNVLYHAAATAGTIRFPESRYQMVRPGLGLFGAYPSREVEKEFELAPAAALVSRIAAIQIHKKGDRLGYNSTFEVPFDGFKKAVLPIGYHDGIPVSLSNRGYVLINGQRANICGRISMDSMIVDITHVSGVRIGTDALLYGHFSGHTLRPEEVADLAQTIVYELMARTGPRVQRIFLNN